MLYKFLNSPFFGCHLLGILLTGACYDLMFDVLKIRVKSLGAAAAVYLSYAAFAVMITYLFRYDHWVQGGLVKVLRHVLLGGSMAALACAVVVPLIARLGEKCRVCCAHHLYRLGAEIGVHSTPYKLRSPISGSAWALTVGLWAFAFVMCALSYPFVR
jgi:hypothetical protein